MRLVRTDIVYDDCSSNLTNTSLNSTIFEYPETMHNITVFYGCPSGFSLGGKNFTCKNDRTEFGFYAEMTEELSAKFPELERCERRIHVLIFREFWVESDGGIDSLQEAASHGFDVYYSGGGGLCGSMDTPENALHCVLPIPSMFSFPYYIYLMSCGENPFSLTCAHIFYWFFCAVFLNIFLIYFKMSKLV